MKTKLPNTNTNRPTRWVGRTIELAIILALTLLLPAAARAGTLIWDGGYPTTGVWNNPGNWTDGVNPDTAFVNGSDLIIAPNCKGNYIGANRTVLSITYSNNCNASFNTSLNSSGTPSGGTMNTLTFLAGNTGITIQAGNGFAHTLGNTANTTGANIVLQGDLTVTHDGAFNYSIVRPITGTFGVTKAGSGTGPLILTGSSTYSGNTTITAGTLRLGSGTAIPDGAAKGNVFVDAAGILDVNAKTETINGLSGSGTVDNLAAGTATLTVGGNDANSTFNGVINNTGGALALTKTGAGILTLSGTNPYTGATTIEAGKLVGVVGGSAANSAVTISAAGAKLGVSITDNTKQWTAASLDTTAAGVLEFSFGAVAPSGSVSPLNVTGLAAFTVQPTVTVAGTALTPGTYPLMTWGSTSGTLPTGVSLPLGVNGSLSVSGSTLNLVVSSVVSSRVKADNADDLNLGSSWTTGTVPGAGDVAPWNSVVTAANTTSLGADTTWAGIKIADPTGLVTINAGNTLTIGASAIDIDMASATADLTLNCPLVAGAANVWDVAAGQALTLGDVVSGSSPITKQGGGTATLSGANTFNAGLTLSAGTLNINNPTALGDAASTFTIAGGSIDNSSGGAFAVANNNPQAWNAAVTFLGTYDLDLGIGAVTINANRTVTVNANTLTVGGAIGGGAFNLTKAGAGTLILNGANTTTGNLNMNLGTLTLAGANSFGGAVNVAGGTLNLNHSAALGAAALTFTTAGSTINNTTGVPLTLNNNPQAWNADFTFGGASDLDLGAGAVTLSALRTVTVNGGGARNFTVGGVIGGDFGLFKAGNGTMVLSAPNTFTGQMTIGTGTVKANTIADMGVASSLGAATTVANAVIVLGNGGTGTLEYTGASPASTDRRVQIGRNGNGSDGSGIANNNADPAYTLTFVNASFNQPVTGNISSTGARGLTLGGANTGNNTIQGIIAENAGSGSAPNNVVNLAKNGAGTWVIAGVNTYTGPTTIINGKLVAVVGGSSASSSVRMNAGTFGIAITDNTQQWTAANLTNTAGALEFDFGGVTPSLSLAPLAITGEVDFNAGAPAVTIAGDFIPVGSFPLMTWATIVGTDPATAFLTLPAGVSGTLRVEGTTLFLDITVGSPLFVKANNTDALNLATSWTNGVVPAATDSSIWDGTVAGANTTVLGSDTAWKRIKILNPGGLVTISSGNTLTLSAMDKEIDMSAATANLTLNCPLILTDPNIWEVASGQTLTLGGAVSGMASITKQGDGAVTLAAANTYNGATLIKAGTLALSGSGTLGNGASAVTLAGGVLDLGTSSKAAGAVSITAAAPSGDTVRNGSLTGAAYTASLTTGEAVVSARLLANGAAGLTKSGAGTLTLANNNTYIGTTTVSAGNLTLKGANVLPAANAFSLGGATAILAIRNDQAGTINHGDLNITATGATIDIGNNGGVTTGSTVAFRNFATPAGATITSTTFTGANDYKLSFASLSLPGSSGQTTTLTPNGTSITVTGNVTNRMNGFANNNWDTLVLAGDQVGNQILGAISDAIGTNTAGLPASLANGGTTRLTKNGPGTWTLAGANTYTGVTTVNDGTLLVNGSVASLTNNLNGGILGGNGTLSGWVNVTAAGTIQPGAGSTSTLTANSLALDGTAVFELNRTNAQNSSRIAVLTSRTITGTLTVNNLGPAIQANDTFTLFSGGASSGDFTVTNLPDISPLSWNLDTAAGTLTAVTGVAPYPTNISYSISGNTLTLTWPASHLGWYAQSNSVNVADTNFWFVIPGSELATNLVITVDPLKTNVFYRLSNP